MKIKYIFLITITTILCLALLVPSAWAKRHRAWEGAAIFLGTAVLIDAFVHAAYANDRYYYAPARRAVRSHHYCRHKKIWVAPVTERIWHKGYYNRRGRWIPGYWEVIHRPGYWR